MNKTVFSLIILAISYQLKAQSLDSVLVKYGTDYQQEKAYLQFDKSSYYAGETIWFKGYMMEGLLPAMSSKTIYVDYIADNGNVLAHMVSPVVDGNTNGQFDIPSGYTGNSIHVRAYTRWMLNFDTAFLYARDLRIITKTTTAKIAKPVIIPTLGFFPEGGELVNGLFSKVAFKATDQWGRPVKIQGVVSNQKGMQVDSIKTIHDGMGYFTITPDAGDTYTAKWKDEKGTEHITILPAALNEGVTMQVDANGTKRIISINTTASQPARFATMHLVGTMNQVPAFKNEITSGGQSRFKRIIPTENLPSGILTITLFDASWNAIAERITFINNHEFAFETKMEVVRWGLSKRKRNELEIAVPENLQGASLSISVTDAGIENDTTSNIISHLLLTSDLKGIVNHPAYYFSNESDSIARQLDLIMLTNGWRRFRWKEVVKGKYPVINYPKDTSYMTLSGKVFGVAKSQLSGNETIVLLVKDKDSSTKMLLLPINRDGTFSDPGIVLFDTLQVYYSLKSKFLGQAEARFMTDRLPAPNYSAFSKNFVAPDPRTDTTGNWYHSALAAQALRLEEFRKGEMMEAVIIKTKQKPTADVLDDKYASGMFKGGDGYKFDLVNDVSSSSYQNIFDYLQGKVAGLMISNSGGTTSLTWRGGAPQLYLDEIQTDIDMITNIPVSDVALVKVFRPPFMGGFGGSNGAIVIYTRKGDEAKSVGKGLTNNRISGYSPIREFYSPNYDTFNPLNEKADLRTTLYWNPVITLTPKKHKATVSFYNNDLSRSFRVVIEGMSRDGLLTHMEQIME